MPSLNKLLAPKAYLRFVKRFVQNGKFCLTPNSPGATLYPAGHFYSPLLDIQSLKPNDSNLPFDGIECWEHVSLHLSSQKAYYQELLERFPLLPFPRQRTDEYRYYWDNNWFPPSDAFTLSAILRREKPRRIVEVGSGFSSAVMLDTLAKTPFSASLTFIEPYPERLYSLLSADDRVASKILVQQVQEVPLSVFDQLEAQDVLFIDSSHVAKVGSDVSFLLLRILPRLKPGVLIHFHDIFYPYSYPVSWIREGRSWNESLFLRAFLVGNSEFEVTAFNAFAGHAFPELFQDKFPEFLHNSGGSIWMRKVA